MKRHRHPLVEQFFCWLRTVPADTIIAVALALAAVKFTHHLSYVLNVRFYDETIYLRNGVRLLANGLPDSASGPLYSLWYFFLSWFVADPLDLYFANYTVLSVLTSVAVYSYARAARVSAIPAAIVSFFWLISFANIDTWPLPSHFAMALLLFGLALSSKRFSDGRPPWPAAIAAALAAYVRPEFAFSAIGMFVLCLVMFGYDWWLRHNRPSARSVAEAAGSLVAAGVLVRILGNPLSAYRNKDQFYEHFSLNYEKVANWWKVPLFDFPAPGSPYWHRSEEIAKTVFGGSKGFVPSLFANPKWALIHVALNAFHGCVDAINALFVHYSVLLPADSLVTANVEGYLLFAVFLFVCLTPALAETPTRVAAEDTAQQSGARSCGLNKRAWSVALIVFPSIVSVLLVYPRRYYIIIPGVVLIIEALRHSRLPNSATRVISQSSAALVGLLIILLIPRLQDSWYFSGKPVSQSRPHSRHALLEAFKKVPLDKEDTIRLAEADGGLDVYIGPNVKSVNAEHYGSSFLSWITRNKIGAVLDDDAMRADFNTGHDPDYVAFTRDPKKYGFRAMKLLPNAILFVKPDLLAPENPTGKEAAKPGN